jgi:hypothetical protein
LNLLESIAALALEAIVLTGLTAALANTGVLTTALRDHRDALLDERRVEQLLDHAVTSAGSGPDRSPAIAVAEPRRMVLHADLNGDGIVDARSAERIELTLRPSGSTQSLVHRMGRQSATIVRGLDDSMRFHYHNAIGAASADPHTIRLLKIPVGKGVYVVALQAYPM